MLVNEMVNVFLETFYYQNQPLKLGLEKKQIDVS